MDIHGGADLRGDEAELSAAGVAGASCRTY